MLSVYLSFHLTIMTVKCQIGCRFIFVTPTLSPFFFLFFGGMGFFSEFLNRKKDGWQKVFPRNSMLMYQNNSTSWTSGSHLPEESTSCEGLMKGVLPV